jgi:ABC-type transport system involved in cytochrome c biogenesis permease subunit
MKKYFPTTVLLLALLALGATLLPGPSPRGFDLAAFGRLPVLADGRLKPMDTVARNTLLVLQGRQRVVTPDNRALTPHEWLLDLFFRPAEADTYAVIRIDNADVLSLFNLARSDGNGGVRFSFNQLRNGLAELDRQAQLVDAVESAERSAFQRAVAELHEHVFVYDRLKFSLQAPDSPDFPALLKDAAGLQSGKTVFESMDSFSALRVVPPTAAATEWRTAGRSLVASVAGAPVEPAVRAYTAMGRAWVDGQAEGFNAAVRDYTAGLEISCGPVLRTCALEALFNRAEPFYTSMILYVVVFLLAVVSWLKWPDILGRAAFALMGFAFVLTTVGIAARMWLEGRPPVTNLYSSALFIGWGAVGLCLILERIDGRAVAGAAGALIGFGTLVIAHHLSLSGDTLEMMRAVLDSNFWLATHVVTVTIGYASTFLAGFLAIIYILRGALTRSLDRGTADALARMVYGIVCFATFFSFVGTVLGGIWADQSWGRFWGWDPKENGALIIVIWNAVILHARWGGLICQRGLMALAVFGNIVTAWSWFGTNMLGIGLHSYGFTDAAFYGLLTFVLSQLVLVGVALLPPNLWRSLGAAASPSPADAMGTARLQPGGAKAG